MIDISKISRADIEAHGSESDKANITDDHIDWYNVGAAVGIYKASNDREQLASLISEGVNLRAVAQEDRDIIAHLVRTGTRAPGSKYKVPNTDRIKFERDLEVVKWYCFLLGWGLAHPAKEVAQKCSLKPRQVQNIWNEWQERDPCPNELFGSIIERGKRARARIDLKDDLTAAIDYATYEGNSLRPKFELNPVVQGSKGFNLLDWTAILYTIDEVCTEQNWEVLLSGTGLIAKKKMR